ISQASASIGVIAGTTGQIADPGIPSGDAIASPVIERIRIASSSAVRGAAVVRRQCEASSSPLKIPIVISELPTSNTTIIENPLVREIRSGTEPLYQRAPRAA